MEQLLATVMAEGKRLAAPPAHSTVRDNVLRQLHALSL
jgi:hypothetical protein